MIFRYITLTYLVSHAILFFMDGFSVSNQTHQRSEEKTSFITLCGTYYYAVMSFDLKNVGDTYQRAMKTIFHDMIHVDMEVCVDDILIKIQNQEGHANALERVLKRTDKYKLKMNPMKFVL